MKPKSSPPDPQHWSQRCRGNLGTVFQSMGIFKRSLDPILFQECNENSATVTIPISLDLSRPFHLSTKNTSSSTFQGVWVPSQCMVVIEKMGGTLVRPRNYQCWSDKKRIDLSLLVGKFFWMPLSSGLQKDGRTLTFWPTLQSPKTICGWNVEPPSFSHSLSWVVKRPKWCLFLAR